MDTIKILRTQYNRPVFGEVALVSAAWLSASLTPGVWRRHTTCVAFDGAFSYEEILDLPLTVLQALADCVTAAQGEEGTEDIAV